MQTKADEQQVLLCFGVRDTGIGIPADRVPSIFERFTQVERVGHERHRPGADHSAQLVRLMGGKIRVKSTVVAAAPSTWTCASARDLGRRVLASSTVKSTGR